VTVVNAGSSSIKFQLFWVAAGDQLERRLKGQIEGVGVKPHLIARGVKGENLIDDTWPSSEVRDVPAALDKVVSFLRAYSSPQRSAIASYTAALTIANRP
jgi:acetate kinase